MSGARRGGAPGRAAAALLATALCAGCAVVDALSGGGDPDGGGSPDGGAPACADPALPSPECGPDGACVAGRCVALRSKSCGELHRRVPAAPDGLYLLDLSRGGAQDVLAYCDMTVDGGGWTLVGRSADVAEAPAGFGWSDAAGAVDDDAAPYALGVADTTLAFTDVLVADHGPGKQIATRAYRFKVPPGFVAAFAAASLLVEPVVTVQGDCVDPDGPGMLAYWGFTADPDHFFSRDNPEDLGFGLAASGFNTNYSDPPDDCRLGGRLNGSQGMIFVR